VKANFETKFETIQKTQLCFSVNIRIIQIRYFLTKLPMKKSILTFISVSLLLTSCSLFQKNNTEQISTLPTNQEQENKDLPPFDDSENND
jgi:hypothetical protein